MLVCWLRPFATSIPSSAITRPNLSRVVAELYDAMNVRLRCNDNSQRLNCLLEHLGRGSLPLPPLHPVNAQGQGGGEELSEHPDSTLEADVDHPGAAAIPAGGPQEQFRAAPCPNPAMDVPYPAGHPVLGIAHYPQMMQTAAPTIWPLAPGLALLAYAQGVPVPQMNLEAVYERFRRARPPLFDGALDSIAAE